MNNSYPRTRTADLVISELADEVLVYDLKTHQAHCLNHLAALIWRNCDGKSSVAEITQRIEVEERTLLDESAVWAALEQLSKNDLLIDAVKRPAGVATFSRRRAMRKIGFGMAAALPLVISIVVPEAAQAATCTGAANQNQQVSCPCNGNGNCASQCCSSTNICLISGLANGQSCSKDCQCTGNNKCTNGVCA